MIAYSLMRITDLVIPSGTAVSNLVYAKSLFEDAVGLVLIGPAAVDGGHTYIIQSGDDLEALLASQNFSTVQLGDPAADISPPGALKARSYLELSLFPCIRIKDSTGNVAADRTWKLFKALAN